MNKPLNIVIRDTDYRYNDGHIPFKLRGLTTTNWGSHFEFQVWQTVAAGQDSDDCWDFGGIKNVDAFMDVLISQQILPLAVIQQITDWGFMDVGIDGNKHFHSSPRYPGILTGIGQNGGGVTTELDFSKANGLVPFTMLPVNQNMTIAEYFDPTSITQEMKDIAMQLRTLMGGKDFILYQWINDGGPTDIPKMAAAQSAGPYSLGIATNDGWNQVHPTIATGNPNHVVSGYAVDLPNLAVPISDNYAPFLKVLDRGYQISYVLQIIVQYIPPPPAPTLPTNIAPTQANVNILIMLVSLYQKLLALLSPTERAKLQGASRSPKWGEYKKNFAKTNPKLCAICGNKKVQLHHIQSFATRPDLEMVESNTVWMCEGLGTANHHLETAHLGSFLSLNENLPEDIKIWHNKVQNRPKWVVDKWVYPNP